MIGLSFDELLNDIPGHDANNRELPDKRGYSHLYVHNRYF
jgi:hypothetical protein